jgi:hypothetical protein
MVLAVANDSIKGFSDSFFRWMMMETSQMVRQRYSLLLVSIPCKVFVLVDVRAVAAEL